MKNTLLVSASAVALALSFLLYQANLAVDAADDEKFSLVELAFTEACLENTVTKSVIECKENAYFYVQELKRGGF